MSTPTPAATPDPASQHTASATPPPRKRLLIRFLWLVVLLGLAGLATPFVYSWSHRLTNSITDDAFVEAHIVNIAPQTVSGHLVRFLVEENDRVEQGQVLAEIDAVPYRDQVDLARSKVEGAEAELRRQEAALARLRMEVPIQIEISRRSLAAAKADEARVKQALKLTEDEVGQGIEEAQAGLEAARADLLLAQQEYTRFTNLQREEAVPLRMDWIAVTLFITWIVSLTFLFGWYRKWGGWTSNAFTATAVLATLLPVVLLLWVGSGLAASEHFRRMFRVRVYVLAMCVRMLMLLQLLAVLTLMAKYCIELRDYPRKEAGWILAPATVTMAASTFLTTWFHRRAWRHFWLLIGVVGCAGCLWWMSSLDNFTSKEQLAWMMAYWGLFLGLFPPAFLQDEVEGLDRRDSLYGGAVAVVFLIVPIVVIPTMTITVVSAWTDRALDAQWLNLRQNRPEVEESSARVADYYRQRGVDGPALSQMASTVLGGFVKVESVAHGIQSGLRFLSLIVGGISLLVTALLARGGVTKPA